MLFSSLHFCPKASLELYHQCASHPAPPLFTGLLRTTALPHWSLGRCRLLPAEHLCSPPAGKDEPGQCVCERNPNRSFSVVFGEVAPLSEKDAVHRGMQPLMGCMYLFLLTSWQGPEPFPAVGSEAFLLQNLHFLTTRSLDQASC